MPQPSRYSYYWHIVIEHNRCCGMPKIMEANQGQASFFKQRFIISKQVAIQQWPTEMIGEDQIEILPFISSSNPFFLLKPIMLAKRIDRLRAQLKSTFAKFSFRRGKLNPLSVRSQNLAFNFKGLTNPV